MYLHFNLGALMEYAVILFLLKKKRKPFRTIDQGLKNLFNNSSNGEAQPLRSPGHAENKEEPPVSIIYSKFWHYL